MAFYAMGGTGLLFFCKEYIIKFFTITSLIGILFKPGRYYKIYFIFNLISWLLYYCAVITSLYAYNSFSGSDGFGNRYNLVFAPIWTFWLFLGIYELIGKGKKSKQNSIKIFVQIEKRVIMILTVIYCFIGIKSTVNHWVKDDVREITDIWYIQQAFQIKTLVNEWSDANFQYYLRHHKEYDISYQENIITAEVWIRQATYEEMDLKLQEMDIFKNKEFYYIAPKGYADSLEAFNSVAEKHGYSITIIYEGVSTLLYCIRE